MPRTLALLVCVCGWLLASGPLHAAADPKNRLRAAKTNQRGVALIAKGNPAKAREAFLQASHEDPTFADPVYNLANLAIRQKDWDGAFRWLRAYSRLEKNQHRAILGLAREAAVVVEGQKQAARSAMAQKDYRGAARHLQTCLRLEPANNHFRLSLAMAQAAAADYPAARSTLSRLVKPSSADLAQSGQIEQTIKGLQALDQRQAASARQAYLHGPGGHAPVAATDRHRRGKTDAKPIKLSGQWNGHWTVDAPDHTEALAYCYNVNQGGESYLEVTAQFDRKPGEDWDMPMPPLSRDVKKRTAAVVATTRFPMRVKQAAADRLDVDCGPGQLVSWSPNEVSRPDMTAWLKIDSRMANAVAHFQSVTLESNGTIH